MASATFILLLPFPKTCSEIHTAASLVHEAYNNPCCFVEARWSERHDLNVAPGRLLLATSFMQARYAGWRADSRSPPGDPPDPILGCRARQSPHPCPHPGAPGWPAAHPLAWRAAPQGVGPLFRACSKIGTCCRPNQRTSVREGCLLRHLMFLASVPQRASDPHPVPPLLRYQARPAPSQEPTHGTFLCTETPSSNPVSSWPMVLASQGRAQKPSLTPAEGRRKPPDGGFLLAISNFVRKRRAGSPRPQPRS